MHAQDPPAHYLRVTHRLIPKTCEPPVFCLFACLDFSLLVPQQRPTEKFTGKVVGVTDGDTIKVLHDGEAEKGLTEWDRLYRKEAAVGTRAKESSSELVFWREVL